MSTQTLIRFITVVAIVFVGIVFVTAIMDSV